MASSRSARAKSVRHRLAQRPRRHHPAVAEAEAGIDHDDREILGERRVLQPVVHHHGRRRRPRPRPPRGGAVARRSRPARRPRAAAARRRPRPPCAGASSTRTGPSRLPPCPRETTCASIPRGAQPLDEGDDRRGLARAAGGQVADADHRHPQPHRRCRAPAAAAPPGPRARPAAPAAAPSSPGRAGRVGPEPPGARISACRRADRRSPPAPRR